MDENKVDCTQYDFTISKEELYELEKNGAVTVQRILNENEVIEFNISKEFEGDEQDAIFEQNAIEMQMAKRK